MYFSAESFLSILGFPLVSSFLVPPIFLSGGGVGLVQLCEGIFLFGEQRLDEINPNILLRNLEVRLWWS